MIEGIRATGLYLLEVLKSEKVVPEQSAQDIFSPRQFLKHVGRRKWNVQKKSGAGGTAGLAQVMAHQHQVVIVRPDEVLAIHAVSRGLREFAVDALIDLPIFGIEVASRWHVMEEWPNNLVGEPSVKL